MPIYEYECPSCHNRFDKRQSFSDAAEAACPSCGADAKRRLQVPAILFKGSGWYATDHRPSSFVSGHYEDSGDSKSGDSEPVPASASAADEP